MDHNFCTACGTRTIYTLCDACDAAREAWFDKRQAFLDAQEAARIAEDAEREARLAL